MRRTLMGLKMANRAISGFPEPLPTQRFKRLNSAPSFFADFRPLFSPDRSVVRGYTF
jgi:hypothetical protein